MEPLDEQMARVVSALSPSRVPAPVSAERLGDADAWLLSSAARPLILKGGRSEQDEADVEWEHGLLHGLAEAGFPASLPVPAFDGQTWARIGNRIWATLSYLPGRALASEQNPDMEAAGAFLARYHRAARSVPMPGQRPTSAPLPRLRAVTPPDPLRRSLRSAGAQGRFARLLDDLEAGLRAIQYESLEHIPIHGDATNDNLIVEGDPPTIVGMIDFGSASLAPWLTDLAAALWRSGRAIDTDVGYDLDRVTRYVAGYHRESPIPKRLAQAIPLLIQGRGLQLISRRVRRLESRHVAADPPRLGLTLARACWAHDHRQDLLAAIATALHTS